MIELMPRCLQALSSFFHTVKGKCTGVSLIDSTKIQVCHNRRIKRHKVFKGLAAHGKTSMGWFYGFKLHLIINELGEIVNIRVTAGNVHDVRVVNDLSADIIGLLLGDKGYVSKKLAKELADRGIRLVTSKRRNMKHLEAYSAAEKQLLSKRGLIETVNDQLKNLHQIEHTRHRSVLNSMVNIMAGVVAYCLSGNKPSFKKMISQGQP